MIILLLLLLLKQKLAPHSSLIQTLPSMRTVRFTPCQCIIVVAGPVKAGRRLNVTASSILSSKGKYVTSTIAIQIVTVPCITIAGSLIMNHALENVTSIRRDLLSWWYVFRFYILWLQCSFRIGQ